MTSLSSRIPELAYADERIEVHAKLCVLQQELQRLTDLLEKHTQDCRKKIESVIDRQLMEKQLIRIQCEYYRLEQLLGYYLYEARLPLYLCLSPDEQFNLGIEMNHSDHAMAKRMLRRQKDNPDEGPVILPFRSKT